MKHTAYNSEEVVDWHNAFLEDNPEGTLGKVSQMPVTDGGSTELIGLNGLDLGVNNIKFPSSAFIEFVP